MFKSEIAVSVRNLSKAYTIVHEQERHITLAETILSRLKDPLRRPRSETFWALKDIEFDIKKGDVVGIVGRNGAGKSTLLKILSRITEPTTGKIELYGRVGSLLEVGTGFHPELTGRENVFLNGAILGMSKAEIKRQFDAIVDFAGVEKFLDTPVKRYSSGMYVRLAFAVAAHLNPEILIVDEVLAVGDSEFQKKCIGKMKQVSTDDGKTVFFVSHNLAAIRQLCNVSFYLKAGQLALFGATEDVADAYLADGLKKRSVDTSAVRDATGFTSVRIIDEHGSALDVVSTEVPAHVELTIRVREASGATAGFTLYNNENVPLILSSLAESGVDLKQGQQTYRVRVPTEILKPGTYRIEGAVWDSYAVHHQDDELCRFEVIPSKGHEKHNRWSAAQFVLREPWQPNRPSENGKPLAV